MSTALAVPVSVNPLKPSAQFRTEAIKSMLAIVAFVAVYIILFILALALAALCVAGGILLMVELPHLITLLAGAGLIGVGIMVVFFLIKFLFDINKTDTSNTVEITSADQPELVDFIENIAAEAGAPRPKKIFISQDVNACVFYNSSFWSMFLPVRKNLMIGLGLVNTLNKSEFKAVIAHEFGHFSQRSMKLGSFVYNVNHIIFNMLFRNTGFSKGLSSFASVHAVFYICAHITAAIVQGIQKVLRQMYKLVNLSYLGLSRQMEFQADLVAARVSGSNNIISSLRTLEHAEQSYQATLNAYNKLLNENKRAANLYEDHSLVYHQFTTANSTVADSNITEQPQTAQAIVPRINISNQWASHPTTAERKAFLDPYHLNGEIDETPAWSLFRDADQLKRKLTDFLYHHIPGMESRTMVDAIAFSEFYQQLQQSGSLPVVFGSYYDERDIADFDIDHEKEQQAPGDFYALFTDEVTGLPKQIATLQQDIDLLDAVIKKLVDTRSFDFEGTKYSKKDAPIIMANLEAERSAAQARLDACDKQLFRYFYHQLKNKSTGDEIFYEAEMRNQLLFSKHAAAYLVTLNTVTTHLGQILAGETLEIDVIHWLLRRFKNEMEPGMKQSLASFLEAGAFDQDEDLKNKVINFTQKDYAYFSGSSYFDNEIEDLHAMIQPCWAAIVQFKFDRYKSLIEMQATVLKAS